MTITANILAFIFAYFKYFLYLCGGFENYKIVDCKMVNVFDTPLSVAQAVANRVKQRRLALRLTQVELAQKAGMPLATYRLFETKGKIAFSGLLQIAFALDCMNDFNNLFSSQSWATLDDMLAQTKPAKRVRHD